MTEQKSTNIKWHPGIVSRLDRESMKNHRGFTVWFTGLPSSGKSTIAASLEGFLHRKGHHTYILDGDNIRHGLNKNLGFSPEDREENIRRIGEVAKLFRDAGIINMVAFVSPYKRDRQMARELGSGGEFVEVFVDCPVNICEIRDPKGAYKKAKEGIIKEFTGISAPYEEPEEPEIHLETGITSVSQCVRIIVEYLNSHKYIDIPQTMIKNII